MRDLVYPPVVAAAKLAFRGLGIRFDITGAEHVPRTGGAVMAINHVSYLDFTFAGLAADPAGRFVRFMAKKEVFDHRISGPLMRGMRHIPVDRTGAAADSYRVAVQALRAGEIVGVFPEATISESWELKEFKTGAVRMALEAGVPLLPTILWGGQRIYTKSHKPDLTRGTDVRIVIGAPFTLPARVDPASGTVELKARMQTLLDQARSTYAGKPRGPQDTWWVPASLGGTAPTVEEMARITARRLAERERPPA